MLYQLGKVPYATVYNFQPWTAVNKQADLKSSLHYPDNLMKDLRRTKIVNQVPVYPVGEEKRNARHNTFYTLKSFSSEHVSQSQTYNGTIALDMRRHQSGLMDILLSFINLYPDYTIEIDCKKEFEYQKKITDSMGRKYSVKRKYLPDAFIKLTSPDQKEYHFIIEFERTKSNDQIRKEKFKTCNELNKFGTYGLSRYTKFLFFFTYEIYNVYARPIEYHKEEVKKHQQAVEYRLNSLIKDSKDLLNDCYRFLPFHNFYCLNEPIWLTKDLKKIALIN